MPELLEIIRTVLANPDAWRDKFPVAPSAPAEPTGFPNWGPGMCLPVDMQHQQREFMEQMIRLTSHAQDFNSYNRPPMRGGLGALIDDRSRVLQGRRVRFSEGEGTRFVVDPSIPPDQMLMVNGRQIGRSRLHRVVTNAYNELHHPRRFENTVHGDGSGSLAYEAAYSPRTCSCGFTSMFTGELNTHLVNCPQNHPEIVTGTDGVLRVQARCINCHEDAMCRDIAWGIASGEVRHDRICDACFEVAERGGLLRPPSSP